MHVFVKEFTPRDLMRTLAGKNSGPINYADCPDQLPLAHE